MTFSYNSAHHVAICHRCATCLTPSRTAQERHLRSEPHFLTGDSLQATLHLLDGYSLRTTDDLFQHKPRPEDKCHQIPHLACYNGFCCLQPGCCFYTRRLPRIREHMSFSHNIKAKTHQKHALWIECKLQTYFTAKGLIDYFVVTEEGTDSISNERETRKTGHGTQSPDKTPLPIAQCTNDTASIPIDGRQEDVDKQPRQTELQSNSKTFIQGNGDTVASVVRNSSTTNEIFNILKHDVNEARKDLAIATSTVDDDNNKRAERVPWLERTGFTTHLAGLQHFQIKSSYCLPSKKDESTDVQLLCHLLAVTERYLQDAYKLCSDSSPNRKMTQQRANILNEFYAGASGKADGFRYRKNASTLVEYIRVWQQLLTYYYRVVYRKGHFTCSTPDMLVEKTSPAHDGELKKTGYSAQQQQQESHGDRRMPQDTIQPTEEQLNKMELVIASLHLSIANGNDESEIKHAIRDFCIALICQHVGGTPFRSPVLSYAAMLSQEIHGATGKWHEPGNYNHYLSALTWTAQLILFDYACFCNEDNDDHIPIQLGSLCKTYFQQLSETPFGYILQWRLYLFKVSKNAIAKYQARWSLDGQRVVYQGIELEMSQIGQLALSEYQQAHELLYHELLFRAEGLHLLESWRLNDDLDLVTVEGSWLNHPQNYELLKGTETALLEQIESRSELRTLFLPAEGTSSTPPTTLLNPAAMDLYEAHAQDFLKRLLVVIHITSGQPLRQPELLSLRWKNTARQRHLMIWEKLVLIYTQYHKGQEQSGTYKDNIRFLPKAVGNLILDYVAYVLPLRQLFLRQHKPNALISPYLWANRDGSSWADGQLSSCLRKACARAQVPRLQTSTWRHFSASICKEKFSAKEQLSFDTLPGVSADAIEDEDCDLAAMAGQSNHSYATFNRVYAGTTTLTMTALLHRGHRASATWQSFFRFDQILHGKRPEDVSLTMTRNVRRRQIHQPGGFSEGYLLETTQQLFSNPDLRFRSPGQLEAVMATLGPKPAEQVVFVAGTGAGKTLVTLLGVSVAGARTTILILPMVALKGDLMRRSRLLGISPHVWSLGSRETPSLVVVSAETACTDEFLDYAKGLSLRQQLDRIIIDECHLTITASDYRPCMSQLGWHVRQVATQTVWLTATLPPVMEEIFIEHNKLIRPLIVRTSTNRQNMQYSVILCEKEIRPFVKVKHLVLQTWPKFGYSPKDKIILYCQTKAEAVVLANDLGCQVYTSDSATQIEKAAALCTWLETADQPAIVATSALGLGFDYPHVRWVIHVGPPQRLTDFSQESGRAGRDSEQCFSYVLLDATWKPVSYQERNQMTADQESMILYLSNMYCLRGVLSQFLDQRSDWRWCMSDEECCQVCQSPHATCRPSGLELDFIDKMPAMTFTGPDEVLRQDFINEQELSRYIQNLQMALGSCLDCRARGRPFNHLASGCYWRCQWISAKTKVLSSCKNKRRGWIAPYVACWKCLQPQEVCRVNDSKATDTKCRFPDMTLPLCFGVYHRPGREGWFQRHFNRGFQDEEEYMLWLGGTCKLGGISCIQANLVTAVALTEF